MQMSGNGLFSKMDYFLSEMKLAQIGNVNVASSEF